MIPTSKIFRSRWSALWWAGGILWMAYDVAESAPAPRHPDNSQAEAPTDATGDVVQQADLQALASAINSN
ncbi:hypothetical protein BH09PSE4_BH09PSE4_20500 [soil metagenome]